MSRAGHPRTVVITGSGLSAAYNPALENKALTEHVLSYLATNDGGGYVQAAAEELLGQDISSFENLLGTLEGTVRATEVLAGGPFGMRQSPVTQSLRDISRLTTQVYRYATAITLNRVAESSHNIVTENGQPIQALRKFGAKMASLGPAKQITFATLNYDGLLHAALIDLYQGNLFDQSDGRINDRRKIVIDTRSQVRIEAHPLRDTFAGSVSEGALLLQLHGSLGWLRNKDTGFMAKFAINDLRAANYWRRYRHGGSKWEPIIVATDRKESAVTQAPFAAAHVQLKERLHNADRVLIAGYGFGDEPVQRLLREELLSRSPRRPLRILVAGKGDMANGLTDLLQYEGKNQISYHDEGIEELFETDIWNDFATNAPVRPFPVRELEHGPEFF